jgi:hypothetical protein
MRQAPPSLRHTNRSNAAETEYMRIRVIHHTDCRMERFGGLDRPVESSLWSDRVSGRFETRAQTPTDANTGRGKARSDDQAVQRPRVSQRLVRRPQVHYQLKRCHAAIEVCRLSLSWARHAYDRAERSRSPR